MFFSVIRYTVLLGFLLIFLNTCRPPQPIKIIIDKNASFAVRMTAEDFKEDLQRVLDQIVEIDNEIVKDNNTIQYILSIPTKGSNLSKIKEASLTKENPGSRGGVWQKISDNQILLGGSDIQGLQYTTYDYCHKILGIDPFRYWTNQQPDKIRSEDLLAFEDTIIQPPLVPLLGYFDNDADELMNLKKPLLTYDWQNYKEMIDALVRNRYNFIHFFDALGRPEYYQRPEYIALAPDYTLDLDYVDKMIDYAQYKGMKVQIDFAMGYQPKSLESQYADCWSKHKDKWKEVWNYYLKETPFGKADIFSLRPRNQVWDWEYESVCGEDKIEVFNEVYREFDEIIDNHNPQAIKVAICYADGMNMFNNGFNPPDDWIIAWSDDGYGEFDVLPEDTKGYKMGTYMHAGFWKNHTVSHPFPHTIDSVMHRMFADYNATNFCLVNGQQFRPFILNLEAYSKVCQNPDSFTADGFYQDWAKRYFPGASRQKIIDLMQKWDEASFGKAGYVQNLWEIKEVLAYLADKDIEQPRKPPTKSTKARVENDIQNAKRKFNMMSDNLAMAKNILNKLDNKSPYFFDQIYHPLLIYNDLLGFEVSLHDLYDVKIKMEKNVSSELTKEAQKLLAQARKQLDDIYANSLLDSHDPKWNGWYDPAVRRPNNGFPTHEMLDEVAMAMNIKTTK